MSLLVALFGLFMAALGLIGLIRPERLVSFARAWQTPTGLYTATAIRIVFGLALVLAAPGSRAPTTLRFLGVLTIIAGLVTPFFGLERFRRTLDWWATRSLTFQRAWSGFALAFGLILFYAVVP